MDKTKTRSVKSSPRVSFPRPYSGIKIGEGANQTKYVTTDKGKETTGTKIVVPSGEDRRKCFQCQGYGHFRRDCPTRRALSILEISLMEREGVVELDESEVSCESEPEGDNNKGEVIIPPDTGLNLVLWRVMHSQPQPLEEDQRSLIFQTRCTVKGRVCNLIIDGGSCTNVASISMVEKLGLEAVSHQNPYKLRCLNKGAEVRVDKQCLVPFSIGNDYKDEVWCDVLPMDACHLLLGRPWEFDKNTTHLGKNNTYTFKQGNKKIVLTPLPPNAVGNNDPNIKEARKEAMFLKEEDIMTSEETDVKVGMQGKEHGGRIIEQFDESPSGSRGVLEVRDEDGRIGQDLTLSSPTNTTAMRESVKGITIEVQYLLNLKENEVRRVCCNNLNNQCVMDKVYDPSINQIVAELCGDNCQTLIIQEQCPMIYLLKRGDTNEHEEGTREEIRYSEHLLSKKHVDTATYHMGPMCGNETGSAMRIDWEGKLDEMNVLKVLDL